MWILERILALVVGVVMISQVIVPLIAGKRVFWLFRRSTYTQAKLRKAQQAEVEAQQQLEAAEHEARALELKQRAEAVQRAAVDNYLNDKLH
jgi:hypothetical protein